MSNGSSLDAQRQVSVSLLNTQRQVSENIEGLGMCVITQSSCPLYVFSTKQVHRYEQNPKHPKKSKFPYVFCCISIYYYYLCSRKLYIIVKPVMRR